MQASGLFPPPLLRGRGGMRGERWRMGVGVGGVVVKVIYVYGSKLGEEIQLDAIIHG